MTNTEYKMNGKPIAYEVLSDGYMIYCDGRPWIHQYEPYIPYPDLSYEDGCIKQISEMTMSGQEEGDKDKQVAELQEQVNILTQAVMEMSAEIYGE